MPAQKDAQKQITLVPPKSTNGKEKEESITVLAKKGKSLIDLITEPMLENYGISIDSHSLFLGSSNTPLPLTGDSIHYGGTTLYLRINQKVDVDNRVLSLSKKGGKRASLGNDISREFFVLLDKEVDTTESLATLEEEADDELELESSWNDVITEEDDMLYRIKVQQQAIWELFTTEINFIKDMKVIIDVFEARFRVLQRGGYLTEVEEKLIFANIHEVYHSNLTFWRRFKEVIANVRKTKKPISPSQLVKSFEGFEELFQPYIQFCNADTSNVKLPDYSVSTNEMVKQYFLWCDNHEQCKRITMAGFLIKPLQRVTKYSLLLKAIFNKTDDVAEKSIAEELMSRVETFVSKINSAINLRQEQEKLNNVIMRLSEYSPVEAVNEEVEKITREYCNLNLKGNIPGLPEEQKRFLLKEGPMKLFEKQGKKDVYAFLFTDVLVITKLNRNIDKYRVSRPPFRLNKLLVRDLKHPGQILVAYLNEYGLLTNAFVLQVDVPEQIKWRTALEKAKEDYELIRTEFGLRDEFWDDDLPSTNVSKNKLMRKRAGTIQKKEPVPLPPLTIGNMKFEWNMVLVLVTVTIFLVLNFTVLYLFG